MNYKLKRSVSIFLLFLSLTVSLAKVLARNSDLSPESSQWTKLKTEPFRGKQDDVFFVAPDVSWYVNGSGKIYKTIDGGASWDLKLNKPGTYFRAVGFIDEQRGFAGNIGTEYYSNVTDTTPLYETGDGGETWKAGRKGKSSQ